MNKTEAQLAHDARNARSAELAAERKARRIAAHQSANEDKKIAAIVERARKGKGTEALVAAFAAVTNPTDWRFGIDAVIEGPMSEDDHALTMAAITFFTCGQARSIRENDRTEFNADGFAENCFHDLSPVSAEEIAMVTEIADAAGFPVKAEPQLKAA